MRITQVEMEDPCEDAEHGDGGIVSVTLRCTLEDGAVRLFTVFLDALPEPPAPLTDTGPEGA